MPRSSQRAVLICIDPWTLEQCEMRPFSYAIRKVQAAALADPALAHWDLQVLDLQTTDIEEFLSRIESLDPDLLGVSAYCWSFPTFIELSQRLKAAHPELTIIFGGPSARLEMFDLEPFRAGAASIDALVIGEGEDTFRHILSLADRSPDSLRQVPGLAVSTGTGWVRTPERPLPQLDSLASPYVLKLIGGDPNDPRATGHLETFRGCPFSCTFCQWGDLSGKSNRSFSTEYLIRELTAFDDQHLRHGSIIDAALNLNQRAFRNLVAAEREVGFFRRNHLITEVYPAHITDEHLAFIGSAREVTLGIGVQSLTKEVLDGVERPFNEAKFRRAVQDLLTVAPRSTIELIVGLPGDSPEHFRETFETIVELGCGVRVYRCLVLPNALMTRAPASFQIDYDLITLRMRSCLGWSSDALESMMAELTDRVAAAAADGAMVLDEGNTFVFHPPALIGDTEHYRAPVEPEQAPIEVSELPAVTAPAPADTAAEQAAVAPALRDLLARAIGEATTGEWTLVSAAGHPDHLLLRVEVTGRQMRDIDVRVARADRKAFRVVDGIAFSYLDNGTPLSKIDQRHFDAAARDLRRAVGQRLFEMRPDGAPESAVADAPGESAVFAVGRER